MKPLTPDENQQTGIPLPPGESWLDLPLQLRTDLNVDRRMQKGRQVYILEDPARGKFYQVGSLEYQLINSLDGQETVGEKLQKLNRSDAKKILLSDEAATRIAAWLIQCNLAFAPSANNSDRLEKQAQALRKQKLLNLINPISMKFNLFNPAKLLDATANCSGWLFTKTFFCLWIALAATGLYFLFSNWSDLSASSTGILSEGRWIWLLLVWLGLKAIHEWAHGITCRRFGGNVSEAGILLLLFTPMPFVNVTSSWRFSNRWHRFYVAAAGMYIELFISFIAMIVWANSSSQLVRDLCFNIFFLSSVTTVLFNANPLMRFDGYYMLTDLLDIPNLYSKSLKWFADRLKWLLFGTPKTPDLCAKCEMPFVRVYGVLAFCWKILICFSLLIGASVLFWGAGIVMAAVAGFFWLGMPVYRFFQTTFVTPAPNYNPSRVVLSSLCILGLLGSAFTILHSPATKSAPAVVQFGNEQIIRANGEGFIQNILVEDGEFVVSGQTLAILQNDELQTEVANLERQISEAEIQSRIHTQAAELTEAQTELKNRESLAKQLQEKRNQLANLEVTAPFAGYVFQRELRNRVGEYLSQGDELMTVAQTGSRKIIVSIAQEDLDSIQNNDLHSMRVLLPGQKLFAAVVHTVDSRATNIPSVPALCASFGGPLPVEPASEPADDRSAARFHLLTPRFDVELSVADNIGHKLNSGQIGRAYFDTRRQSLGAFLFLETSKWFTRQIEQATVGR